MLNVRHGLTFRLRLRFIFLLNKYSRTRCLKFNEIIGFFFLFYFHVKIAHRIHCNFGGIFRQITIFATSLWVLYYHLQ